MVLLPFTCLTIFLTLSVKAFIEDKITFVYEWDQLHSRYLATKIDLNLEQVRNNPHKALFVAHLNPTLDKVMDIRGAVRKDQAQLIAKTYAVMLCTSSRNLSWIEIEGRLVYGYCRKVTDGFDLYVMDKKDIASLFQEREISETLLVGQDGHIIAGPSNYPIGRELRTIIGMDVDEIFESINVAQGRLEIFNQKDKIKYLAHFYRIPDESLMIISLTPRTAPQRAALFFVYKGILFVIALLFVAIFASLFISSAFIRNIVDLRNAMTTFGAGEMNIHLEPQSKDEIGHLASMFNKMVDQIKQLVKVHEEKAKVDAEMGLAAELQQRFFPKAHYQSGSFQFAGFYEPANKCGGDWWTYTDTKDHFIVCIGDVTGHGLSSALITAAARAVVAEFKSKFEGPAKAMEIMNRAIYETSTGALNMTCMIAAFDKKEGVVTYSNASHEPTYYFNPHPDLKRSDINVFLDVHGPRLGENFDSKFSESILKFKEPSVFLFYSDGLKDIMNSEGTAFDERRVLRLLSQFKTTDISADEILKVIKQTTRDWRQETALIDDLSYFILKK
jgi:phosphoserine phosphatase RsbU/P